MLNPPQEAVCSSRNKSNKAPNENGLVHEKNWGRDQNLEVKGYVLVVKVKFFPFFFGNMKERGSMYEHFPLCGSARAAI